MKTNALYKRTWFRILISLLVLFLLLISVLPYGIQYGIQDWFKQQGADSAKVEDVDINLFTGKLSIRKLLVKKADVRTLQVDQANIQLDWIPFFKKRIWISSVSLDGVFIDIQQTKKQRWILGGISLPDSTPTTKKTKSTPWGFALNAVALENIAFAVKQPQQNTGFTIHTLKLDKLISGTDDLTKINISGKINQAPVNLNAQLKLFIPQPQISGKLSLKNLDLSMLALQITKHKDTLKGLLTVESDFKLEHKPGAHTQFTTKSNIQLTNLDLHQDAAHITQDSLNWTGNSFIQLDRDNKLVNYRIEGGLDSENLTAMPEQPFNYHHDRFNWKGIITSAKKSQAIPEMTANLSAKGLALTQRSPRQEIFSTKSLNITNLHVLAADNIKTKTVTLGGLRAYYKAASKKQTQKPALLQASQLKIASFSLQPSRHINIGNAQLTDALIYLHRLKNGQLMHIAKQPSDKAVTNDKKAEPAQAAMNVALSRFNLSGKSKIRIIDEAVTPVFNTELKIKQADIKKINTSKPGQPSPFTLNANLDKYSSISFSGDVSPFGKKVSLVLNGELKGISMPPLSGYTADTIGYNLRSGQLNATIKADIKAGKIDALVKMTLSNLEVKSAKNKQSDNLTLQLSMPLDSALSLLRNKNNDIKLELPVKGDTDKPDFQIGGIINTAIATAMKKATMSYLIHVLQPYGSLITIAKLVKSASNAVTLNPIYFSPASSELNEKSQAYLKKLLDLLQQRPSLRIKVCGVSVNADKRKLLKDLKADWLMKQKKQIAKEPKPPLFTIKDSELNKIALARSAQIKSFLVTQKINAKRLFLCNPEIDTRKDAKPRVDLSI